MLARSVSYYNWVGFYLQDPNEKDILLLGPFVGEPTEHTRIPFGRGICGQAAITREVFLVKDVTMEDNYLSCSPRVKSEIVLPVEGPSGFLGELDIDSHTPDAFSEEDKEILERVCVIVAPLLEELIKRDDCPPNQKKGN